MCEHLCLGFWGFLSFFPWGKVSCDMSDLERFETILGLTGPKNNKRSKKEGRQVDAIRKTPMICSGESVTNSQRQGGIVCSPLRVDIFLLCLCAVVGRISLPQSTTKFFNVTIFTLFGVYVLNTLQNCTLKEKIVNKNASPLHSSGSQYRKVQGHALWICIDNQGVENVKHSASGNKWVQVFPHFPFWILPNHEGHLLIFLYHAGTSWHPIGIAGHRHRGN